MTLCTLFNTNYLDKGLVLYNSLEKVCRDFKLYVLAMDDKCYDILRDLSYEHLIPIRLHDFEDKQLLAVKGQRGIGEYCWTCTSSLIRYILHTFNPEYCTYIDADLYFYDDPEKIVEEMKVRGASVQVIGHRFPRWDAKKKERIIGKYCVQFNTFKNDKNGLALLEIWRNQCLECCSTLGDGIHWGDQKYQDNWCRDYDYVIETENIGAGVAPWNIAQYRFVEEKEGDIYLSRNGQKCKLLFYHFEDIQYLSKHIVQINAYMDWGTEVELVNKLYKAYLKEIDSSKDFLKDNYGIEVILSSHPASGVVIIRKKKFKDRIMNYYSMFTPKNITDTLLHGIPSKLNRNNNIIKI